ncbi:uncharacterized protein [Chironomus tepperi]|uniref:uncharacterized protein n=1 Tax=Chironomus tepperi TaxID=113505 RepID=UPI00391F6253
MNVNILIIFVGIFLIHSCVDAQSADCKYGKRYYWTTAHIKQNKSSYSCNLKRNIKSPLNKVTIINGQHKSGQTDDDVNLLNIHNSSSINTFSSTFCQKFKNLKVISSHIKSIDGNSLENCEHLDILDIKGTELNYIPTELLTRNSKLSQIYLTHSQMTTLPENLFSSQNNLKVLSLIGNQISYIPLNIFNPILKLEALTLENNKLQSISSKWFKNLGSLIYLLLNENQIAEVPDKSFEFLTNLDLLYLYKNRIKLLYSNSFFGLHSLRDLWLNHNEITELPHNTFKPLSNLKRLALHDNKLTIIDAASFGIHKHLADIYLQNNKINQIDEKFIDNTALNVMNIEGNICSNGKPIGIEYIKVGLKTCFENYKKLTPQLLTSRVEGIRTNQCGQSVGGVGNIVGGKLAKKGKFPWVAVLSSPSDEYICGATLVSKRKAVTAAHCIRDKNTRYTKLAREIIIQLGIYDLDKKFEIGRASHALQRINVHPDWNAFTQAYDADIAVLVLDTEVTFNEFIQPICLVQATKSELAGVVVGYGKSEDRTKKHENIPKIIDTPIHSNDDCLIENSDLTTISSGRTFCGGTGTGVGVCNGDSGSGLFVTDGTSYYLSGIVSSSLKTISNECDVDTYSVFTNVTKYIDWINGVSTNRFE